MNRKWELQKSKKMNTEGCPKVDAEAVVASARGRGSPPAAGPASVPLGIAGPGSSKNALAAEWRWGVWGRAPSEATLHGGIDIH